MVFCLQMTPTITPDTLLQNIYISDMCIVIATCFDQQWVMLDFSVKFYKTTGLPNKKPKYDTMNLHHLSTKMSRKQLPYY